MKKIIVFLLAVALVPLCLAACSTPAPEATPAPTAAEITPAPTEEVPPLIPVLDADKDNHWYAYSDGTVTDIAAHTPEDGICTGCGAEITSFEDGETWVMIRNDKEDTTLWVICDAEGNTTGHTRTDYVYDEEGRWASQTVYEFGTLSTETLYATETLEEGFETYPTQKTTYGEDGSRLVETYTYGTADYVETQFDAEGNQVHSYTVTHEYNTKGYLISVTKADGDEVAEKAEYTYDRQGNVLMIIYYHGTSVLREEFYETTEDGFTYLSQVTNQLGEITLYDQEGNKIN